jgi:hypothetical protein
MKVLINVLAFQAGWFSCVIAAANGMPWVGLLVTALVVSLHVSTVTLAARELQLIAIAVAMGLVFDSLLVSMSWLSYPNGQFASGLAPYWILSMWALFATTLNVSMRWMHGKLVLSALFGLVGGPLSYLAGARLGAVTFVEPVIAVVALGAIWAVAMPVLVVLSQRFDGVNAKPQHPVLPGYVIR